MKCVYSEQGFREWPGQVASRTTTGDVKKYKMIYRQAFKWSLQTSTDTGI